MKRIITFILAISLMASMALSASAFTLSFDLSKAQPSINKAATELVQEVEAKYPTWNDYFTKIMSQYWFIG